MRAERKSRRVSVTDFVFFSLKEGDQLGGYCSHPGEK